MKLINNFVTRGWFLEAFDRFRKVQRCLDSDVCGCLWVFDAQLPCVDEFMHFFFSFSFFLLFFFFSFLGLAHYCLHLRSFTKQGSSFFGLVMMVSLSGHEIMRTRWSDCMRGLRGGRLQRVYKILSVAMTQLFPKIG